VVKGIMPNFVLEYIAGAIIPGLGQLYNAGASDGGRPRYASGNPKARHCTDTAYAAGEQIQWIGIA
jgi:hypothetical protein